MGKLKEVWKDDGPGILFIFIIMGLLIALLMAGT